MVDLIAESTSTDSSGGGNQDTGGGSGMVDAAPHIDSPTSGGTQTLTQTTANTDTQVGIACANSGGYTLRNSYYRVYTLSDYGITRHVPRHRRRLHRLRGGAEPVAHDRRRHVQRHDRRPDDHEEQISLDADDDVHCRATRRLRSPCTCRSRRTSRATSSSRSISPPRAPRARRTSSTSVRTSPAKRSRATSAPPTARSPTPTSMDYEAGLQTHADALEHGPDRHRLDLISARA